MQPRACAIRALIALGLVALAGAASPAPAAADIGYRGPSYSGAIAPTGQKPQSKLWVVGSTWFGVIYNSVTGRFEIYRLDRSSNSWSSTGTAVDERDHASGDALWDGSGLYIASAGTASTSADSARISRYRYNTLTKTFTLDSGFPVTISSGGMEAVVLDKDTTGKLWITFTQRANVYVAHSTTSDRAWTAPFVIPVNGADNLTADDLSGIVAYNGRIGVMWSNQNDWAMHFASHGDGDPDSAWTSNTAVQQTEWADDHLNLKALASDSSGQVFAATKTSLNGSDPLILLMVLGADGGWRRHTFATATDNHTRPLVLLDAENRRIYELASSPCCSGGIVYYKRTSLDNPAFAAGLGTPLIESSSDVTINNVTSTKQPLNATTDLVALAGDDHTLNYWHNTIDIESGGSDRTPPQTSITSGPSGLVPSATATFRFSSNESGSTFECALDGGAFASCSSPTTYAGLTDGVHSFSVRAIDQASNIDASPAVRGWQSDATAPETVITAGPQAETNVPSATFEFEAGESGATFECSLDSGLYSACSSPAIYDLADGSHSFSVRSRDSAGNVDPTPAARSWTTSNSGKRKIVLSPLADATTVAAQASTNFGASPTLDADGSPQSRAYLRFDPAAFGGGVESARLRLFAVDGTGDGPAVYGTQGGWGENTINWSNRPARIGGAVDDRAAIAVDEWVEYDVTSLAAAGIPSFELAPTSSDGFKASSRQAASNRPELIVNASYTLPAPIPPAMPPPPPLPPAGGRLPIGGAVARDATEPAIAALTVAPRSFAVESRAARSGRGGATVAFELSEDATVRFDFEKASPGRIAGKRCRRFTRANRAGRRCLRYRRLASRLRHDGELGGNSFRFSGRIGGKGLDAGRYRLIATPVDAAGHRGRAASIGFRIRSAP